MRVNRLVICGVGLIGGSLARALKAAGAVGEVVGVGRSEASLARARELGVIDRAATSMAQAVPGADIVVLAAPVAQTPALLAAIRPHLGGGTLVTDAGSTKSDAVAAARAALDDEAWRFVPGHPIAGAELSGVDAAKADLYRDRRVVLCPQAVNRAQDVARVRAMWEATGALVSEMSETQHDRVFASVSHLPHVLSYALIAQILEAPDAALKFGFAGGGFRDFTRIAASNPEMWRDICVANRDALLAELDGYLATLGALRQLIDAGDGAGLEAVFARTSQARTDWAKQQEK
ncbi:prephenate dehydrogenase/arogenate dehydrogenase family protein [Pandoraea nosoerga]|nr:prephenate dehydrogenase/arogenate dehydrogenase family protein [Pandoraea nosoerga]MBN4666931.1 prephenate dehydrogenase/arogenate dehydrogenase family protein [Pandoraea nosoerga]MBN4677061.1 prephenate dehydrogenase/arogenate dehydrogenase family protein [Pandoraea nosoerga]MBN4681731.1 prephenate dehydrogenase/arogenate dehydrogenase family protein [Pandoraea nosoerga]MBN4744957.1 prephenate dehydrogenase/arogenate dehydrogenase family protein [Pandoraea nosoerga]